MLILQPEHNTIYLDTKQKTCRVTAFPGKRKQFTMQDIITQKDCLLIMTIAYQADYTFDITHAEPTKVFKNFFSMINNILLEN